MIMNRMMWLQSITNAAEQTGAEAASNCKQSQRQINIAELLSNIRRRTYIPTYDIVAVVTCLGATLKCGTETCCK